MANASLPGDPKARGAFYTCRSAAEYMADWAVRGRGDTVLEPCFGDGVFLEALSAHLQGACCFGAEIDAATFRSVLDRGLLAPDRAHRGDFLRTVPSGAPFNRRFDAIVGNPPYVRLRHVPEESAAVALAAAKRVLGEPMQPSGSLWMPFVLHACAHLRPGGRLAFVLPYELTYVRYARALWRYLGGHFGSLRCVRVHDRLFPDLLQEVMLLFADGFGGATEAVTFETCRDQAALLNDSRLNSAAIPIREILDGRRPFVHALLPQALSELLCSPRVADQVTPLGNRCQFSIGYVAGDKAFFHPSADQAGRYGLPPAHLRPAITGGRELRSTGLYTSAMARDQHAYLYDPPGDGAGLTPNDLAYIAFGESRQVHRRYKCRIRDPWYKVPGLAVPDAVLSVFSDRPVLVANDGGFLASNSLLCGRVRGGLDPSVVAASWYNSLTLLSCELEVHSLGGGVMILIPGEANQVLVPRLDKVPGHFLDAVDRLLRSGNGADPAFALGDEVLLQGELGLSRHEVALIGDGLAALRHWRVGFRTPSGLT